MLNLDEINNTIEELENANTTFDNCLKLASLYIVREQNKNNDLTGNFNDNQVITEYHDILPKYREYVDIKTKFQLGQVSELELEAKIGGMCQEIHEFVATLYSCADLPKERQYLREMMQKLNNLT